MNKANQHLSENLNNLDKILIKLTYNTNDIMCKLQKNYSSKSDLTQKQKLKTELDNLVNHLNELQDSFLQVEKKEISIALISHLNSLYKIVLFNDYPDNGSCDDLKEFRNKIIQHLTYIIENIIKKEEFMSIIKTSKFIGAHDFSLMQNLCKIFDTNHDIMKRQALVLLR